MSEKSAEKIFEELKEKFKGDTEVIDEIERAEKDIEYIKEQEKKDGYSGQSSIQFAKMIAADIEYWN